MASTSETGYGPILSKLETLIAAVTGYGPIYQPTKSTLQIPYLQQLLLEGRTTLAMVNETFPPYNTAKIARMDAFEGFSEFITRLMNVVAVSDLNPKLVEDLQAIARRIKGIRVGKKGKESTETEEMEENIPETEEATTPATLSNENGKAEKPRTRSIARTSRDLMIEHLALIITLLQGEPMFQPNEMDLQIAALQQRLENMRITNSAFVQHKIPWDNARMMRDEKFYADKVGICDVAMEVKKYSKALHGVKSPQYRQISKLSFPKRKL